MGGSETIYTHTPRVYSPRSHVTNGSRWTPYPSGRLSYVTYCTSNLSVSRNGLAPQWLYSGTASMVDMRSILYRNHVL
ncbi:hypothetical protein A0H81_11300 [Grifola frondosa]|uniref:Uncharacterized protein n=1 Tax=Grifola frondosa TaxID=5627 RepID=A0A1C7LVN7_GRIFR|nr:hypothetical protein A0H81_11300 [Grifola frondosa]